MCCLREYFMVCCKLLLAVSCVCDAKIGSLLHTLYIYFALCRYYSDKLVCQQFRNCRFPENKSGIKLCQMAGNL